MEKEGVPKYEACTDPAQDRTTFGNRDELEISSEAQGGCSEREKCGVGNGNVINMEQLSCVVRDMDKNISLHKHTDIQDGDCRGKDRNPAACEKKMEMHLGNMGMYDSNCNEKDLLNTIQDLLNTIQDLQYRMDIRERHPFGNKEEENSASVGDRGQNPMESKINEMKNDPISYKRGEKGSEPVGCIVKNNSTPTTEFGASLRANESPECKARLFECSENESDFGPDEYIHGDSDPNESEQFPDTTCLGVSCASDNDVDYPYDNCSTNEFVNMCDYVATSDTQLNLSRGDKVLLLTAVTADWWWVQHNGVCGYVPSRYLRGVNDEQPEADDPWQDDEYYGSYNSLKLHLEMLSDYPRTQTYKDVITRNSSALKGKRILDLGCGTGIISFFCVKLAQPELVYAVEASDIAEQTCKLVYKNGFSDKVQVLRQRAEELHLPAKVDVLVSEWMGTCLLFEFMLESVLIARDRWLKDDGVMWPSTAAIHMVPCSADKEYTSNILFWDSPYELDFSVLKPLAVQEFFSKPKPDYVLKPEDCLSQPYIIMTVDMRTLKTSELERMSGEFKFHIEQDGSFHGFTAWFSVQFQNIEDQGQVELDTGPFSPLTHWKHTLFMLDQPMQVYRGDLIVGSAVFQRNPIWRRHLSVMLNWSITSIANPNVHSVQKYYLVVMADKHWLLEKHGDP